MVLGEACGDPGEGGAGGGELAGMRGLMRAEFRAAVRMVAAPEFAEGVRCAPAA